MSTSHDTVQHKPAETGESGSCCGGHKPQPAEPAGKPVEAAKVPSREAPSPMRPSPARLKAAAAAPSIVRRNPRAGLPSAGRSAGAFSSKTLAWCGKWHHDGQHARSRRPVLGPGRARNQAAAAARRTCPPCVGQPGLGLDHRHLRPGGNQPRRHSGGDRGLRLRCAGEALPRHVCEEHPMPGRSPPAPPASQSSPRVPR